MRWREVVAMVPMSRVAVVAPSATLRTALVRVADTGVVEFDHVVAEADLPMSPAARELQRLAPTPVPEPRLAAEPPDLSDLVRAGRGDLLAGEVELTRHEAQAVVRDETAALLGWSPTSTLPDLSRVLSPAGAAVVALPRPRGVEPPTLRPAGPAHRAFAALVDTYAVTPYEDVDPTVLAGVAYALMFGAMFGDLGHGAMLVIGAVLIRSGRPRRLARLRPHWLLIAACGAAAAFFGVVYGEFFGPTGVLPAGLIAPMEQPVEMLVGGIALGAVLIAGSYALGMINRIREGGWRHALYAPSGVAGATLFLAAALAAGGWYARADALVWAAAAVGAVGLVLAFTGLLATSGGGASGVAQATVELFDVVIRLGTNVVSFARLAAFGLTHAVLGWIVWTATTSAWNGGGLGVALAVVVFVVGNGLAFGLEALVAAVQALRLEYYELFSRVFQLEGRAFHPWHVPTDTTPPGMEES
jgi:V/A-type H+-transporting ATPase subunit I